ncbi:hypothetical protein KI387_017987 [Taxus chinensis]|uniref:Uncharacterized protein n=1 Tax=Taxus chinensis TaxID=29808 RepID=A0AA38GK62_TAXCH|nr:hypothetical protein KI387_017987 [Taxus chinensis]
MQVYPDNTLTGQGQSVNIPFLQPSVGGELFHGPPNSRWETPLTQATSLIVTHNYKSQKSYSTDKNQMSHGSLQSSLCNNDYFQVWSPSGKCLEHTVGHSVQCSPSNRSCLSGGSPSSSQISQTFPSDSQNLQSAESGYSDDEKPSLLKKVLHELETALLGPDRNESDNTDSSNEETGVALNSEWSLETLNSVTGSMYSETERAQTTRVKHNECQLGE